MAAKKRKRDRWRELCDRVSEDDSLPCRDVGVWTEDKLYYWNRYIEITTSAMVAKPQWPGGIIYVDLFGGPGICTLRDTGRRIPGSALLAAWAPKPFDRILICEKNSQIADACSQRMERAGASKCTTVFRGDCNSEIHRIVAQIPDRALTLAFVDPEGLHAHFETLRTLANGRRVDFLVLFADRMDIVRNVALYANQEHSNLDDFIGPNTGWREQWQKLPNQSPENVCKLFTKIYTDQLTDLGYRAHTERVMRSSKSSLYRVIYASKSERGLEFWTKISRIDRSGQQDLF